MSIIETFARTAATMGGGFIVSHLSVLLLVIPEFATILADKVWVILQNDTDSLLWTSDNPVML
jgi:hypothetical protein